MKIKLNYDELIYLLSIMDTTKTYIHINENEDIKEFTSMVKEYASEYYFSMSDMWHITYKDRDNYIGVNHHNHMISLRGGEKMPSDVTIIEYNKLLDFINKSCCLSIDIMDMV